MKIKALHDWSLTYAEATALQDELRALVLLRPLRMRSIRYVAGADVAVSKRFDRLVGAVTVFRFPEMEQVEQRTYAMPPEFPYVPGLLSFREIPVLLGCFASIEAPVDVVLCDGHGIAHPRGLGLATHLGLLLATPTIGCAKSLLVGSYSSVGREKGAFSPLRVGERTVGSVLRTREDVKPVFVSPGHLTDTPSSRRIVLTCATRFRLPEPTRWADRIAGELRREIEQQGGGHFRDGGR